MKVTINNINKSLRENDLPFEIVKGNCYFWFAALDSAPMGSDEKVTSIYSNHLRGMTVSDYVDHVREGFKA